MKGLLSTEPTPSSLNLARPSRRKVIGIGTNFLSEKQFFFFCIFSQLDTFLECMLRCLMHDCIASSEARPLQKL